MTPAKPENKKPMLTCLYDPGMGKFHSCIEYVVRTVLEDRFEITVEPERNGGESPKGDAILRYSNQPTKEYSQPIVKIMPSDFFGESYGNPTTIPESQVFPLNGTKVIFGNEKFDQQETGISTQADLLASAFFMLTRFEEVCRPDVRDNHGRFPGKQSLAFRSGFINKPIVDDYTELLANWFSKLGIATCRTGRQFKVHCTHDVDTLRLFRDAREPLYTMAKSLSGKAPLKRIWQSVMAVAGLRADPFDNIGNVLDLDLMLSADDRQFESTFFFMVDGPVRQSGRPAIDDPVSSKALSNVLAAGCEIGLHTSYQAGESPQLIAAERKKLSEIAGCEITRNRHHYLAWREPDHIKAVADSGINWDSTMGYADTTGFRLGVCRPVKLFDPIKQTVMPIEEHPLVVMDTTLSSPLYLDLDEIDAFAHVTELAETTRRHQGEFVMLWHNHMIADIPEKTHYHARLYPRIINYLIGLAN